MIVKHLLIVKEYLFPQQSAQLRFCVSDWAHLMGDMIYKRPEFHIFFIWRVCDTRSMPVCFKFENMRHSYMLLDQILLLCWKLQWIALHLSFKLFGSNSFWWKYNMFTQPFKFWTSLLTTVHNDSISVNSFSGRLKAELFCRAYGTDLAPMWQLSVNSLREHKCPYLLT